MDKWDYRFLDMAKLVSSWSKDPSTKVGAVIASGKLVESMGYNGFPAGIADDERLADRETKYKMILHAEQNALMRAEYGHTIYTYPFPPCSKCAAMIIAHGIRKVVAPSEWPERWNDDIQLAIKMFEEAGIKVVLV